MRIFKCLMLSSVICLTLGTAFASSLSFAQYSKLSKADPQVLIELLTQTKTPPEPLSVADFSLLLSTAYYALSQYKPALSYAEQGLAIADLQQQNPVRFYQLQLARALAYDIAGTPAKALAEVNAAVNWATDTQHTELLVAALYSRGALHISLVNYLAALSDLNLAYQLAAAHEDIDTHQAEVAGMIALVYEYRREDALAIPYFSEAADYQRNEQNWVELSIALYGLGRALKNTGDMTLGLKWLTESATLARQVDDWQGVAYAEKEIAGIKLVQGNFSQARELFLTALQLFATADNPYMQLDVNLSLAKLALQQQDAAMAQHHLQQAKQFADAQTMPVQTLAIESAEAELLALTGNYQQAFQQIVATYQRKQQLENKQSSEQLHQLRVKYDVDAQQAENKLLHHQNELHQVKYAAQKQQQQFLVLLLVLSLLVVVLLIAWVIRARKNKQRLEQLADTDGLTGVYNRRKIMELFQQQFEQAQRYDQPLSVGILDLDWFKQINDKFGHQTGDEVLWRFAALCKQQLRQSDLIGRIGGEEFMVIFPCTDLTAAEQLAKRLCCKARELENMMPKPGLVVSVSIGLAGNTRLLSVSEFIAAADEALYLAKMEGRDQVKLAVL